MNHQLLIAAVVAGGCIATPWVPARSSRGVLGPEGSEVVVDRPVNSAALELTQLFGKRGFVLVDRQQAAAGQVLRLKGARRTVTNTHGKHDTYSVQYGSVFYIWLVPRGDAASHVSVIGRATFDDREVCTADPGYELAPCDRSLISAWLDDRDLVGDAEAEIVHGVYSELRLLGMVPSIEQAALQAAMHERCLARRRDVSDAARRIDDARARANVLRTLPDCEGRSAGPR